MSADDSVQGCDQALFSHRVFTAVTAEHKFAVAIYKIFEQCLLLDSSSPRTLFSSILGVVIVDFISGMSSLISAVPACQCFILWEPNCVRAVKIVTRSENLGSIRGGLSGHQPEVKKVADMSMLRKRFVAQHKKNGKDEGLLELCFCRLSKGTPAEHYSHVFLWIRPCEWPERKRAIMWFLRLNQWLCMFYVLNIRAGYFLKRAAVFLIFWIVKIEHWGFIPWEINRNV